MKYELPDVSGVGMEFVVRAPRDEIERLCQELGQVGTFEFPGLDEVADCLIEAHPELRSLEGANEYCRQIEELVKGSPNWEMIPRAVLAGTIRARARRNK